MHPDTTGGEDVSADYPGVLARLLADCKGPDMVTVFANGCCGNLNHRDIRWADPQHGPREAPRGSAPSWPARCCETFPHLKPVAGGARCGSRATIVKLPLAPVERGGRRPASEVVKAGAKDPKPPFLEQVKAFQALDVAARDGKPLGGRGAGHGPGRRGGVGVAARRDLRRAGAGDQEGVAVPRTR